MPADPLLHRLERLETAQLADLLRRRPDVAPPRAEPHDLAELAERLAHPVSLARVLQDQPLPSWQLVEAALALGGRPTSSELAALLADADPESLERIVDSLHELAVLTRDGGHLQLPDTLRRVFPAPLGLGEPLADLLAHLTADTMRAIARNLGLARPKTRQDAELALLAFFADPANIERVVAGEPDAVRTLLLETRTEPDDRYYDDPQAYRVRQAALHRATTVGLVIDVSYGYDWRIPLEVTRALRGPDYRAPFDVAPPPVPTRPAADRAGDSAAAATDLLATLLAVLDHLARHPLKALKTGGVGARELTKLAKTLGASEPAVRLVLELSAALDLLDLLGPDVTVNERFGEWRDASPDEQFAAAAEAWWTLGYLPSRARDDDDKPQRALVAVGQRCELCVMARHAMVDVLTELDAVTDIAALTARVAWHRPAAHLDRPDDQWREAELLGVVAGGAVTALGRALHDGDDLAPIAKALLPAAAHHATFGSDLTVFVAGSPAARVSAVLDSAADREGRGGAITWRFTPGSVRRAFDDGATAEALLAELAAVSHAELPQPLRYLVADVARQHGTLRLTAATSVIRSDDAALLALVAADRKLAKHGLRLLAPTVLSADVPVATLLAALRASGYFPVIEGPLPDVAGLDERATTARGRQLAAYLRAASAPDPDDEPAEPDWRAVATRIKTARRHSAVPSATAKVLARLNAKLSVGELRQLASAVDQRGRVGIEYVSGSGVRTRRAIDDPQLLGPTLVAWCELRQDQREFTVSRIVSVEPV